MKKSAHPFISLACAVACLAATHAYADYESAYSAIQKKDYAGALPLLNEAADKNDPRASNALGAVYFQGLGVNKDEKTALQWFEKSAAAGNTRAMNTLANIYKQGTTDTPKDVAVARQWAWRSAQANDAEGQYTFAQSVLLSELNKLDASGKVDAQKYMALAKRTMAERELEGRAYTMLSRASERGHQAASSIAAGLLLDNVGMNNSKRVVELINKLPVDKFPPALAQPLQQSKQGHLYLQSLGQTHASWTLFKESLLTILPNAIVRSGKSKTECEPKNVRISRIRISRDMNAPEYVPVDAVLLKDAVLVKADWQETWTVNVCGTEVDVPVEFQADGGGGAYFQTKSK